MTAGVTQVTAYQPSGGPFLPGHSTSPTKHFRFRVPGVLITSAGTDPDRLSVTRSPRGVRRQVPTQAALSPERPTATWDRTLAEITRRRLPVRGLRAFPSVKHKRSGWGLASTTAPAPSPPPHRPMRSPSSPHPRPPRPSERDEATA
ncbi:hypothetical protein Sgleb_12540 [Streptomyces glebosus]|uniref:Uncharacterized protein n=1 Tax=Streptomyces glebosus TaxID=249580 RepID=A0A640SPF7_9ACTN|nr:hypothetical protein Sgleb_12540 [Streptomyces glebosus]GHG78695.1 hypothetical protein GCM10010513_55490 [Streptomyces glebosus]